MIGPGHDHALHVVWFTPDRFDVKPDKSSWLEMARCLRERGWRVTIAAGRTKGQTPLYPEQVSYLGALDRPFAFRASLLVGFVWWLLRHRRNARVVIINPDALWLVPLLRAMGLHVHLDIRTLPVVSTGVKGRLDRFLFWTTALRLFLRKVDGYSFITARLRAAVESEFGVTFRHGVEWQSGVNLGQFDSSTAALPRPNARFRIFYHGSISRKRGIHRVIEAMALTPFEFDAEFMIVGDGPDRAALQQLAEQLGVGDRVVFRGFIPYEQMPTLLQSADVCICPLPDDPAWNVSSPLKLFEYMACQKPMILTPIPAHLDVLAGYDFVVWTAGLTALDFRMAIEHAWQERERLGRRAMAARDLLRGTFEWTAQAEKLGEYLESRTSGELPAIAPERGPA